MLSAMSEIFDRAEHQFQPPLACLCACAHLRVPAQQSTSAEAEEAVAGYWKQHGPLTQVVLRNAGHMVPHDAPLQAQAMLERWIEAALQRAPRLQFGIKS